MSSPYKGRIGEIEISFSFRFPSFVNVKTVDEEGLTAVVPRVWWSSKDGSFAVGNKQAYDDSCDIIRIAVEGEIGYCTLILVIKYKFFFPNGISSSTHTNGKWLR